MTLSDASSLELFMPLLCAPTQLQSGKAGQLFIEVFHRADGRFVPNADLNAQVRHAFIKFSDAGNVDSRIFNFFSGLNQYHEFKETSGFNSFLNSDFSDGYQVVPAKRGGDSSTPCDNNDGYEIPVNSSYSTATSWESSDGYSNPNPLSKVNPSYSAASSDFYTFMQDNAAKGTQGVPANFAASNSVPIKRSMRASHQEQLHSSDAPTPPDPLDLTNNGSYQTLQGNTGFYSLLEGVGGFQNTALGSGDGGLYSCNSSIPMDTESQYSIPRFDIPPVENDGYA